MKITDEMVGAAMLAYMKETAAEEFQVSGWLEPALRAALTAALAVQTQQGVEVKKLEWEVADRPSLQWLHKAETVLGSYTISAPAWSTCGFLLYRGKNRLDDLPTVEAAKAAAQSDYETRIRSALVDVPAVESEPEPVGYLFEMFYPGSDRWSGQMFSDHDPAANLPAAHTRNILPLYAHPPRSLSNEGGETITLTVKEAEKLAARLEFDASWDKCGDGYYSIKSQLRALSTRKGSAGNGAATGTSGSSPSSTDGGKNGG